MTWQIVADSSCDLTPDHFSDPDIGFSTVPLKIIVDRTEYADVPSTDVGQLLSHMKNFKGASSSACPAPEEFCAEYEKADNVIVITITSALSGTYNSALQARNLVLEEHPEKNIFVLDSRSTAGSMVLLVRKAQELIHSGKSFGEVTDALSSYAKSMFILFALESYDMLIKTGRMSRVAGLLAGALNIHAVACNTPQGEIQVLDKPRGEKGAIRRMVELVASKKDITGLPVIISHCGNPAGASLLRELLAATYRCGDISILHTRCLTSFYAGPGGLLMCF